MKTSKLRCFILLSLLLVCATKCPNNAFSQTSNDTELYPVRVNGKEGYIDATGRMVIRPRFDYTGFFSEGLASVRIDNKYGFIDKTEKFVSISQFSGIIDGGFSDGMASVCVGDRWGYIDNTGRMVIDAQFDGAYNFYDGLARIQIGKTYSEIKFGYIDKTGKIVISPMYNPAFDFHEGYCVISRDGGFRDFGFIDKTGRDVFEQYIAISYFSEGLAFVDYEGKQCCIDRKGQIIFHMQQDYSASLDGFKEGLALAHNESGYGFVDKTGKIVISPQFDMAANFSEGLACVRIGGTYGNGRYGFVDKAGTYVINPQYNYAESFRGGLAPVIINNQFHYIDKRGNVVWSSSEVPSYILTHTKSAVDYIIY